MEKDTWWYWLWVHLSSHGSNFNRSHNTTSNEREEISKKVKKQANEGVYMILSGVISIILIFGIVLYAVFK